MQDQRSSPENFDRPPTGCLAILWRLIRGLLGGGRPGPQPPGPTAPQSEPSPIISFLPGQVSFLAEHSAGIDDLEDIAGRVRADLDRRKLPEQVNISADRVVTLRGASRTISLVFGDIPAARDNPARLIRLVNELNRQLIDEAPKGQQGPPADQRGQADRGYQQGPAAAADEGLATEEARPPEGAAPDTAGPGVEPQDSGQPDFRLTASSPNWLASGAPQPGTGVGPGARPAAMASGGARLASAADLAKFKLPSNIPSQPGQRKGQAVDVAVLDTAPCREDLDRAYRKWGAGSPPRHWLIASLLGPGGPLEVIYAGFMHLLDLVDRNVEDHQYVMADHGLFAAGIIHSIAPSARIRLIEAFNPYGVGSLESLARAFEHLIKLHQRGQPLIVNCSLVMNIPQPDRAAIDAQARRDKAMRLFTPQEIEQTSRVLEDICDLLAEENVIVVAAAGNDGKRPGTPPPARYPARYQNVTGVGALRNNFTPTGYTNISDRPHSDGFATFGGGSVGGVAGAGPDEDRGILGVYIGAFPDGTLSESGWAFWAGTSFATPVISGILAEMIGQGIDPASAVQMLHSLRARPTPIGDLIEVTQVS